MRKFVKLIGHTYACNKLTNFEYVAAHAKNGNYANLRKLALKNLWKHIRWTSIRRVFWHLERLCATRQLAFKTKSTLSAAAPLRSCLDLSDFSCALKASLGATVSLIHFFSWKDMGWIKKGTKHNWQLRHDDIGIGGYLAGPLCNGRPFGLFATRFFLWWWHYFPNWYFILP